MRCNLPPLMTALGLSLLCLSLLWPPQGSRAPGQLTRVEYRARRPSRQGRLDEALREARRWQQQARQVVAQERDALERWDPAADQLGAATVWRQQMACDRSGYLRRAREVARQAADLARTQGETHRVTMVHASLECESGHHALELRHARRLMALEPRNRLSLLWLRRAARCNSLKSLEKQTNAALTALEEALERADPTRPVKGNER